MTNLIGIAIALLAGYGAFDLSGRGVRWLVNRWRARDFASRVVAAVEDAS